VINKYTQQSLNK